MKNRVTGLIAVLAFLFIFMPAIDSEAAAFRQTNATANSITISWDSTFNEVVDGYRIYVGTSSTPVMVSNNTNSYTLTGLQQGCAYSVRVLCRMNGRDYYFDKLSHNYIFVKTQPRKMQTKNYKVVWNENNTVSVEYIDETSYTTDKNTWYKYANGVEFKVKDLKGKTKKTIQKAVNGNTYFSGSDATNTFSLKIPSALKNKGMKYQLRSYIQLANGKKIYSQWTENKVVIPQADISKLEKIGSKKVKIQWKKVADAVSYTIWKTTNGGDTYKKIATVKAKTRTYTIPNLKRGSNNGVLVTAKVKVKGKKYNSGKFYYNYYD